MSYCESYCARHLIKSELAAFQQMNVAPKRSRLRRICLVATILLSASIITYLSMGWRERAVSHALAAQVTRGYGTIVHISQLTSFPWQQFFVFGPYTPPELIHKTIGIKWHGVEDSGIDMNKGFNLLVFVADDRVVLSVRHPRSKGDFTEACLSRAFTPDNAAFSVARQSLDGRLLLSPL